MVNISDDIRVALVIKIGRKIKHKTFGNGMIVKIEDNVDDVKLYVAFDNNGVKKLLLDKAPIEFI